MSYSCYTIIETLDIWAVHFEIIFLFSQTAKKCKNPVDVGFIVDSSGSLRRQYGKEKEFVKALADTFSISKDGSRGGVITFSWNAELSVKFSDYESASDFNKAVDGLPLFGHTTRIDKALLLARDELLKAKNGARANVPKLLVLLTDGAQTADADAVDPGDIAAEIRQSGVKLVVIGIGKKVDSKELLHMAGEKSNLYQASNFDELKSSAFVESVSKTGCDLCKFCTSSVFIIVSYVENVIDLNWMDFSWSSANSLLFVSLDLR